MVNVAVCGGVRWRKVSMMFKTLPWFCLGFGSLASIKEETPHIQ
jgi:hypothetical protein